MPRALLRGNDAIVRGALLANCQLFFGYPITPASEIAEAAAREFPRANGTFLQAESETAAINMVYGAAASGLRTMTASSSPGISLMQEGVSYAAGAELPCVIVDVMRAGPGLGSLDPEQSDYNQLVKGGGHGNYRCPVLAPSTVQEMCDLTIRAFEIADRYRTPVYVAADGYVAQMMEPLTLSKRAAEVARQPWAIYADRESKKNLISSIYLDRRELEAVNLRLQSRYREIEAKETMCEMYRLEDADCVLIGYGIVSRILRSAVDKLRTEKLNVGMLRPVTLFPFPKDKIVKLASAKKKMLVVEMSNGQMVEDVRLAAEGRTKVGFYGRLGGNVPTVHEVLEQTRTFMCVD